MYINPTYNSITYIARYNQIDKYEIMDHNSRIVLSGTTLLVGNNGKITHSGLTYNFEVNNIYTYKAYFLNQGVYYIANQTLIQTNTDTKLEFFKPIEKPKNTFKTNGK